MLNPFTEDFPQIETAIIFILSPFVNTSCSLINEMVGRKFYYLGHFYILVRLKFGSELVIYQFTITLWIEIVRNTYSMKFK